MYQDKLPCGMPVARDMQEKMFLPPLESQMERCRTLAKLDYSSFKQTIRLGRGYDGVFSVGSGRRCQRQIMTRYQKSEMGVHDTLRIGSQPTDKR